MLCVSPYISVQELLFVCLDGSQWWTDSLQIIKLQLSVFLNVTQMTMFNVTGVTQSDGHRA